MRSRLLAAAAAVALLGSPCHAAAPKVLSALTNTAVAVKASPGLLVSVDCDNANAALVYLQWYDTTGAVTVGTTAAKYTTTVPATVGARFLPSINFYAGMKVAATTTSTGGTAPGTALNCSVGFQ